MSAIQKMGTLVVIECVTKLIHMKKETIHNYSFFLHIVRKEMFVEAILCLIPFHYDGVVWNVLKIILSMFFLLAIFIAQYRTKLHRWDTVTGAPFSV